MSVSYTVLGFIYIKCVIMYCKGGKKKGFHLFFLACWTFTMTRMNLWNCQQPWHDSFRSEPGTRPRFQLPSLSHPAAAPASVDQRNYFLSKDSRSPPHPTHLKPVGNNIFQLLIQLAANLWIIQIDSLCSRTIKSNSMYCLLTCMIFFLKAIVSGTLKLHYSKGSFRRYIYFSVYN